MSVGNHISKLTLRSGPAGQLTSQLDTNDLGGLQLPGETSHDIDSVSTTDTNGRHTKTTSVRSVGVGSDHQTTGEGVVLKNDLVDDTRARLPETNVVLGARGGKEVVDLLVDLVGTSKILVSTDLGLDQVVTVDSGRSSHGGHTSRHELQDGHLGSGILAGNTVRAQLQVRLATLNLLAVGVVEVGVQDLLGVGERAVQAAADNVQVLGHLPVEQTAMLVSLISLSAHIPNCKVCQSRLLVESIVDVGAAGKLIS